MFFILEGEGEVRIGDARHPVKRGDVIACPPGGPGTAHQIVNTSDRDELALSRPSSTRLSPEIVDYPDSEQDHGVYSELPPGRRRQAAGRALCSARSGASLDYWDGE